MNELIIFTLMMLTFGIAFSVIESIFIKIDKKRQRQRIRREMQRQLQRIENEEEIMKFVKNCTFGGTK